MVETDFRPENRTPDQPDPDDPGLFIPEGTETLPVVDETGKRIGHLEEGYVYSGSFERITIRVDPELRREKNLPEVIDVEAAWIDHRDGYMQLEREFDEALDEMGFNV